MKRIYKAAAGVALPLSLVAALAAGAPAMAAKPTPSGSTTTLSSTAVVAAPSLSLAVTSAVAGAQTSVSTTVTASGFPNRTNGTISSGTETKYLKTSSTGGASSTLVIPTVTAGPVTVTAKFGSVTKTTTFTVSPAPVTEAPPSINHTLRFGVTTPNTSAAELDAVKAVTGEAPSIITFYQDWKQPVPVTQMTAIKNRGAVPVVGWEPWQWGVTDQSAYSLDNITAGNHDAYINQWAQGLKSYGNPVMLRFGHEMNGDWYPWAEGVNGNESGDYVAAYKHVHDIFKANGVTNVQWVWNPNTPYWGSTAIAGLYPGDAYVDIVALDGYNWGTTQSWGSVWQSPSELFGAGLTELRAVAPGKEIIIAETASAEVGGNKAAWNAELISYLDAQPDVTGVVWFNHNKEVDWRIDSSSASATSFATGLANRE